MNAVEVIGRIIEIAQSNLEIPARIRSILNVFSRDLAFDETLLFSFDKDKKFTCRYASEGSLLLSCLKDYRCLIGEGIVGTVGQRRTPYYYTALDIPPRFGCLFYGNLDDVIGRYRSFVFLPVSDDSYLYGVLLAVSTTRAPLRDPDKILLSMLCREIGGVLRTNELFLSTKKRINELATLSEVGKAITAFPDPAEALSAITLIITRALNARCAAIRPGKGLPKLNRERFVYGDIPPFAVEVLSRVERSVEDGGRSASASADSPGATVGTAGLSFHSAPIISRGQGLATLTVGFEEVIDDPVANGDLPRLVQGIASYLSSGLENMALNMRLKGALRELSEAQRRIIEQEKLRSLGEMTANIAHEIKNPLVVIGGFTKRLAKRLRLDAADSRYVDIILKEVDRLEKILGEVLDYVKEGPIVKDSCDLNEIVEETLALFSADASWENMAVVRDYEPSLPPVYCDGQQIRQVFINILMNSHEALDGGGTIVVRTALEESNDRMYVTTSFTDTGGGMDPAILENVFNPFFTTKERGTGLGLAISNKIILNHMGHIEVHNMPGRGVTFTILLPATKNGTTEGSYGNH
jgi:signal transduction histidine kinase